MEPLKEKAKTEAIKAKEAKSSDTKSAGKPLMHDNNDDNEFATTGLKANFSVETKQNDRDEKVKAAGAETSVGEIPAGGSPDKVESETLATASALEQKFSARMDELVSLVEKAGEKIQRLGEALVRIGDQVEQMPERRFGVKSGKNRVKEVQKPDSSTTLN